MNAVVTFMGAWIAVSIAAAFAIARVMAFAARKDTAQSEMLAAYARRPRVAVVRRDQRRA